MDTNLSGRLRNTSLPKSHGMMPLFEAVINSIHSIEEANLISVNGIVRIDIIRNGQTELDLTSSTKKRGAEANGEIIGFKVVDNGIGFTDANLRSFQTLDSDHKQDKGCRGVGRLLWLKAFNNVNITSIYNAENGELKKRSFSFNRINGVGKVNEVSHIENSIKNTVVFLDGFLKKYQKVARKTAESIAKDLFEHCLWYFVRPGGAPKIIIHDGDENISLDRIFEEHMVSSSAAETITIKEYDFELIHVKLRSHSTQNHVIAYCASNRLVKAENIYGKIPGLYGKIKDDKGDFIYACYISSAFLDERVRAERTDFDIEDEIDGLFEDQEISFQEISNAAIAKVKEHLCVYLEENKKAGRDRVENFVSQKAPRYRSIIAKIAENDLFVDPNISDKDLDITLHKYLSEIENKLLSDGHDIMDPKDKEKPEDYLKRIQDYLNTAEDIKKSDLANYVFHRKVILDLLNKAIERQDNGKYAREDLIHKLIMPMGKDSNCLSLDNCNLWLVDERLAFHNYLASDKTLNSMPITGSSSTKEPDICALNVYDNPLLVTESSKFPLASLVIVEIKRPMRNDAKEGEDKNPIEQATGYLEKIRQGGVMTAKGRPIPRSESIPGFCFIICDLTSTMEQRCKAANLKITSDKMGYFGYNDNYAAYIEVSSFERLVNAAKERNKAFFDKLGLPTT
jgi:hypothetical protein